MAGFRVDTSELAGAYGHQAAITAAIGGSAGLVRAAAAAIVEGAAEAGAASAGAEWGAAWEAGLAARAALLERTGDNLAAAADAYRATDESQMRG
jgi:hypothetical protein